MSSGNEGFAEWLRQRELQQRIEPCAGCERCCGCSGSGYHRTGCVWHEPEPDGNYTVVVPRG